MRDSFLRGPLLLGAMLCAACPGDDGSAGDDDHDHTEGDHEHETDEHETDEHETDAPDTDGPSGTTGDDESTGPGEGTGPGEDSDTDTDTGEAVDCSDQMILDLGLVGGTVSDGEVLNAADGDGWSSTIDATAGGIAEAPNNPWVYLRFTDAGLERVDVDDLQALESTDWDIAAKRFGVRLNGGVSGPSEVAAAAVEGSYEDLAEVPADAALVEESFYTDQCVLVDDGSGQGAPAYALTPWWSYPGCVATTGVPFVLRLADGRHLKLVIDAYYESGQDGCNEGGMMGMGSANFGWRWAFLE